MRLDNLMQELAMQAEQGRSQSQHQSSSAPSDYATAYFNHSSGPRIDTEACMMRVLREQHPDMNITSVSPSPLVGPSLLSFADETGQASYKPATITDGFSKPYAVKRYVAPARRIDGPSAGQVVEQINFGKYDYSYESVHFTLYIFDGRDGSGSYPHTTSQFLVYPVHPIPQQFVEKLIRAAGRWASELHNEIWVFDSGYWRKDAHLYASMQKAHWRDVILDPKEKAAIQNDARRFFDSRERYSKLRVPWKRGVIYHGPPGNGKTISIKALMHELYDRKIPVPTLYVKSFRSFSGPEGGVASIFQKARAEAPCLLVLEDLDSLITDEVRSYFLNEVDGIAANDGVMMIGSTNHLERLDPGISKRPSRFDRKFLFPKPSLEERVAYCEYWRGKLKENEEIKFPEGLSTEVANITDDFSFAYLQEAFVAALLAIAFDKDDDDEEIMEAECDECGGKKNKKNKKDKYDDLLLWRELKKAIKVLRDEI